MLGLIAYRVSRPVPALLLVLLLVAGGLGVRRLMADDPPSSAGAGSGPSEQILPDGSVRRFAPGPADAPQRLPFDVCATCALVESGGALVVADGARVSRLDPDTGSEIWSYETDGAAAVVTPAGPLVLVAAGDTLVGLRVADGRPGWRSEGDPAPTIGEVVDDVVTTLRVSPERSGEGFSGFDVRSLADGERIWGGVAAPFRDDDRIVTLADGRLRVRTLADGSEVHDWRLGRGSELATVGEGLAVLRGGGAPRAVDLDSGETRFELESFVGGPGTTCSIMARVLGCATRREFRSYDLAAGGRALASATNLAGPGLMLRLDGELLAAFGGEASELRVIEARTGKVRIRLPAVDGFDLTQRFVIAARAGALVALDPRSGEDEVWAVDLGLSQLGIDYLDSTVTVVGDVVQVYAEDELTQDGVSVFLR